MAEESFPKGDMSITCLRHYLLKTNAQTTKIHHPKPLESKTKMNSTHNSSIQMGNIGMSDDVLFTESPHSVQLDYLKTSSLLYEG